MRIAINDRATTFGPDGPCLSRDSGCEQPSLLGSMTRTLCVNRSSAAVGLELSGAAARTFAGLGCDSTVATVVYGGHLPHYLADTFSQHRQIHLVAVCERTTELLRVLEKQNPDVLLLAMPTAHIELVSLLRQTQACSTTKPLIITDRRDPIFIETILRYGAKGCICSTSVDDDVTKAIVAVKRGELWLERSSLANALCALVLETDMGAKSNRPNDPMNLLTAFPLTRREREIAALLAHGLTNKDIAKSINVSTETVKKHLQSIFNKLGVHRRTLVVRDQLLGG